MIECNLTDMMKFGKRLYVPLEDYRLTFWRNCDPTYIESAKAGNILYFIDDLEWMRTAGDQGFLMTTATGVETVNGVRPFQMKISPVETLLIAANEVLYPFKNSAAAKAIAVRYASEFVKQLQLEGLLAEMVTPCGLRGGVPKRDRHLAWLNWFAEGLL